MKFKQSLLLVSTILSLSHHTAVAHICVGDKLCGECPLGRELYRGQFLCYGNARVGIKETGDFVYQVFESSFAQPQYGVELGHDDGMPMKEISIHHGNAKKLRMRSSGDLELRDFDDDTVSIIYMFGFYYLS